MPHINIKHFPLTMTDDDAHQLVADLTAAVTRAFGCEARFVSIALDPVDPSEWNERVYQPEITVRRRALIKMPGYDPAV
jgi:4-oxalocrotonate tautomerase